MRMVKWVPLVLSIASVFSAVCNAEAPDRIVGAIETGQRVALAKSLYPKAQAQFDEGPVEPSFELSYVTLTTTPSAAQQKALNRLLAEQQDPASPNYHRWLTTAEYADRFGLSRSDISRITAWLKAEGFTVLAVGGGRNTVIFKGTAAQVQNTFKTAIHRYKVDGEEHFANSTPVTVPAALQGIITGVHGLHDFRMRPTIRGRSLGRTGGRFSPDYYDSKWQFPNFMAPADIGVIYDVPPTLDGTGQSIAIVGQTDIFLADINDFRTGFGFSPYNGCTTTSTTPTGVLTACSSANFVYRLVGTDSNPPAPTDLDDLEESDLDLEWSGAIAPNAQIIFVNAPTAGGVIDALETAINPPSGPPLAPIISMSYGLCEAEVTDFLETELSEANSEGVTLLMASGDSGAAECDLTPPNSTPPYEGAVGGLAVNYPASSPSVTGVGGTGISYLDDANPPTATSLTYWTAPTTEPTNGGTAIKYIPELAWNDDENIAAYCSAAGYNPAVCEPTGSALLVTNTAQLVQEYSWIIAGGGGASNCYTESESGECTGGFPQPLYQSGLSVPSAPAGVRYVPDVSLLASPGFPGYIFCTPIDPFPSSGAANDASTCATSIFTAVNQYASIIGGTSAATPTFAAFVALINQQLGGTSATGLGNINTMLYSLAQSTPSAFHHTTSGDNMVYCQAGTPAGQPANIVCPSSTEPFGWSTSNADATTGYNLATGLGSVDLGVLATAWGATRSPSSLSVSPSLTQTYQSNTVTLTATVTPSTATGNVTFSYSNGGGSPVTLGSATVTSGVATFPTTSLPVGTNLITASYGGNGSLSSSSNTTTVTILLAFSLTSNATTYTVTPGQTATVNVTATTNGSGFSGNLTYTCTLPSTLTESTCTGPTSAVPVSQGASFMITTTAASAALRRPFDRPQIFYAALLPGLFGIMFTFGSRKRALSGMRMLGLIMVLGFSTLWLGSCSGNNSSQSNPGTLPGSYTITISAESGSGQAPGATGSVTPAPTLVVQ